MMTRLLLLVFPLVALFPANAESYPDMVGKWSGEVRVIESGRATEGIVAQGGMQVRNVHLVLTIDAQQEETFMGRSRNSQTPADQPSARVWGTIRSKGTEAIFITGTGARGQLWFNTPTEFEFCLTSINEELVSAYCATLTKE